MKPRVKKILAAAAATVLVAVVAVAFYAVFFTTPRMRVQENIRAFEAAMPLAPASSVPQNDDVMPPGPDAAPARTLAPTGENIAAGTVYYGYYCSFCHGKNGDGEGPVGDSYMPKPADLHRRRLHNMSDAELLRAILAGTGHEPVLERVVPREAYPYLVLFVRSMNRTAEARVSGTITLHHLKIIQ